MTDFILDLSSTRARRARYADLFSNKGVVAACAAVAVASVVAGTALLLNEQPLGWLVYVPAVIAVLLHFWNKGDLRRIAAGASQQNDSVLLHEVLEPNTLAHMPGSALLSAFNIWEALKGSEERYFIGNRYGIGASFFETFVSREPGSAQTVWQKAQNQAGVSKTNEYSNIVLFMALITSVPDSEQILRRVGLELKDVQTSIDWMHDIKAKRALVNSKQRFGGIGRDWAYGYTPILRNLGHNISEGIEHHGFFIDTSMHAQVVQQMAQIMGSSQSTITLVGDEGVGKTTAVYSLAEKLLADPAMPQCVRYNQIVQLDASTLIANARRPGELENLMIQILNEAQRAKNIILFFDEAQMFFGNSPGSVDLTNILQPVFESGNVRIILAMNPQNWQRLSSSGLAARLSAVNVPSADEASTLAVLRDKVGIIEYSHKVTYTYQALQESYKLGSRYVTTQAMPGAALAVLQQAGASAPQQLITREVIQHSVEQTYGIKLQTADASESDNLLHLEDDLRKQVISQDRAISVIANALRRSRSGVGNPDRPIGTFLFLGPTGVGKTELSKALARSYFGDETAMIRVDMNQFVAASDVARLISPTGSGELGFLGEVRKKPFSVILLDEIEKAHPSVVNTLLQMLDEGMMQDSDNRSVSFRDAIIIATSNAGADEIRRLIDEGKPVSELETTFVDTLIAGGSFAPEFINRFDEVVLFKPLSQEDLLQVIDLIVAGINKNLDAQKVAVSLTDEAKRWLVAKGYDSKLGARPMRRVAQHYVENIVAKRLLEHSVQSGEAIRLDVADFEQSQ